MIDTDVTKVSQALYDSSFWTMVRPGRWINAVGDVVEIQYMRGEGTVTFTGPRREPVWKVRGREVYGQVRERLNLP